MKQVIIVGAGFCGTMTAVQLLRNSRQPLHIRLIDKSANQIGKGIAYSTTEESHLLNTAAGNMSAFPDDPDHFVRWADSHARRIAAPQSHMPITRDAYLPRRLYGEYLSELLRTTIDQATQHTVEILTDEVAAVEAGHPRKLRIRTISGCQWDADDCVLAVGHSPPTVPEDHVIGRLPAGRYLPDPWSDQVIPELLQSPSCLLVGSGLTMLDVVMAMHQRGYQGTIHVLSRHGLVPLPHTTSRDGAPSISVEEAIAGESDLRRIFARIRSLARPSRNKATNWQAAIDALRPHTCRLWQSLTVAQRRQFLRHARPYWDHHRHRVAPSVRRTFDELVATGRVQVHHARLESIGNKLSAVDALEVRLRCRDNGMKVIAVHQIVNCTGPAPLTRGANHMLVDSLVEAHPAAVDELGLGLTVTGDMRLPTGLMRPRIFTLGPPTKGQLWECTAVPECRQSAARLASALIDA